MRSPQGVCLFSLNFPPEPTGIAPYAGALADGLSKAGFSVTAHVAHPHYPEWIIADDYGQWTRTEERGRTSVRRRLHYVPRTPRGYRRLLSELTFGLRLIFDNWRYPAAIVSITPSLFATALVALRLRLTPNRPPLIIWVQDLYGVGLAEVGEGSSLVQRIVRWIESSTFRAADHVVVIHERFNALVTQELGVAADRVSVIRNWTHLADPPNTTAVQARRQLGWPADVILAVHTGNMGAKQGLENIVDAARLAEARNSSVHFVLVGDGGERKHLESLANGVSHISFVDPLDDHDYHLALSAADVLVVNEKPGVASMAVPSKLTSYFNAQRPIVAATDRAGITAEEIFAADAGLVVPAGDPEALLSAIQSLCADEQAAERYGKNGRQYRDAVLGEPAALAKWSDLIQQKFRDSNQN
ncbi:glycosyltransferase family 4 protein [Mycolicibacterium vaccae]|uniref:Group 1 glycosyl transferase n=1 Tax=Mycolicibacterium vaccae ATCC 25954 TaxID=1194972 RepID=K0UX20_MYCVA|nr:glycosyltransferase family 4 protein [Mycolicibacterium vaccae]EJZ11331.1 group 1 glycosyl transferase [Mycolicibacterium vaccae ATCC 25954]